MRHPLSRCAASPVCTAPSLAAREGGVRATGDTLAAGRRGRLRPLLGVPELGCAGFLQLAQWSSCHVF
ncbi:MAG: hypothetical protein DI604_03980 [Delftia acidovorans]|nr:MAG: hypothetical protein DI604_03980 [Delftia acidovorans]